ncbi:hypothetical protein Tco_0613398 [Tanacetum coccineum]
MESQSESIQTVSALKLPVLKTEEYDLWSMRMEQYLTFIDHAIWEVIVNGDLVSLVASASAGTEGPIPPKTAEQKLARKNELKAKSTLMLAIPDEHLLKFYACKDAKSLWEAIKNRFGRNKESKKSRRPFLSRILKTLLHQVKKDWIKSMIENTSSTNEAVNTAHDVSTASSQGQASSSTYVDDVMFSFFANQSNSPQLDNEDLEQIDTDDLEEMDLKWQVAMLTMRGNRIGDNARRVVPVETLANALMVTDGMGYDWSYQAEEVPTNFSLMDYTSQGSSSSDSEVHTCSKDCLKSYKALQKQYDQQREALNKSNIEIIGYQMGLESLEASRESDEDDNSVNDRLKTGEGFHAVPPPYTENYMPPRPDLSFAGLDEYVFMTAVRKTTTSVPETKTSIYKTSKDIVEKPKTVRSSAPIIEEWESDSDDDYVSRPLIEQNKPSCAKINFVKSNENTRKFVIEQHTYRQAENLRKSQSSRVDKINSNGMMTQKLGDGIKFKKKACFVCGSLNHLIKDCNYKNKMVEKPVLNNKGRVTSQREIRPVWNNAQRERVHDFQLGIESYQQKVNLTAPTMTFPVIEDHEIDSHKFCDATLNRVLEGLKSYNNDVKYGYVQKDLTKDETEYLKLFEEEIEERLKHRRQMRRWEMYVNGRPLGLRRERLE